MRSQPGARRALPVVALAITALTIAATPAGAVSGSLKVNGSTTNNQTFAGTAPISLGAALTRNTSVLNSDSAAVNLTIAVPGPQAGPFQVDTATGSDKDLAFTIDPHAGCDTWAKGCTGNRPAYNGRYTVALTGGTSATLSFMLEAPPAAPTGVAATATAQHRVQVAWSANPEPDVTSYDVFTAAGDTVATDLPASTLSYEFDLPSSGYGGEHSYVVRAHRLACDNCQDGDPAYGTQTDSPMSDPASVTLDEPTPEPTPSPTDDGSGGGYNGEPTSGSHGKGSGNGNNGSGSGTGNGGGYTSGGSNNYTSGAKPDPAQAAQQQRLAFGLTWKQFAPKLGAPKLPPLPKFAPTPIPEGTYDPTLPFGDRTVAVPYRTSTGGGVATQVIDTISSAFQGPRLFRSIAIALILLLLAGHLRYWLNTEPRP